uniref:Uncharacterized protein n=1 Tax=Oryza brachyantha TaxID=4533 RepID=J3M8C3_ORYBR
MARTKHPAVRKSKPEPKKKLQFERSPRRPSAQREERADCGRNVGRRRDAWTAVEAEEATPIPSRHSSSAGDQEIPEIDRTAYPICAIFPSGEGDH